MAICSNCYSGCTEIHSDKCIRYTGVDIEVLGIKNGDSVNYVQSAIIGFLVSTLDGSGIKYELDAENLCTIVSDELTDCTDITVVEITNALSKAICSIDTRVTSLENSNTSLESSYTPDCVPAITGSEGTHAVLQAVINHLCTVTTDLDALELDVSTNYVLAADINTYIANYISGVTTGTEHKLKMIPYTVMEYYGSLTYFDATGAGTGDWEDIYLCNGNNGTPDKRGRIPVGSTSGMGGGTFPTATDPLIAGNPTYNLYSTTGTNTVALTDLELPSHTHAATAISTVTPASHQHFNVTTNESGINPVTNSTYLDQYHSTGGNLGYALTGSNNVADRALTSPVTISVSTSVTNTAYGGGQAHSNIPPVLACHYIIYIPSA